MGRVTKIVRDRPRGSDGTVRAWAYRSSIADELLRLSDDDASAVPYDLVFRPRPRVIDDRSISSMSSSHHPLPQSYREQQNQEQQQHQQQQYLQHQHHHLAPQVMQLTLPLSQLALADQTRRRPDQPANGSAKRSSAPAMPLPYAAAQPFQQYAPYHQHPHQQQQAAQHSGPHAHFQVPRSPPFATLDRGFGQDDLGGPDGRRRAWQPEPAVAAPVHIDAGAQLPSSTAFVAHRHQVSAGTADFGRTRTLSKRASQPNFHTQTGGLMAPQAYSQQQDLSQQFSLQHDLAQQHAPLAPMMQSRQMLQMLQQPVSMPAAQMQMHLPASMPAPSHTIASQKPSRASQIIERELVALDGGLVPAQYQPRSGAESEEKLAAGSAETGDLAEMLHSSSEMFELPESESRLLDEYKAEIAGLVDLSSRVEKLQLQMKEVKQFMRSMTQMEEERLLPQIVQIQALMRGALVRKRLREQGVVFRRWTAADAETAQEAELDAETAAVRRLVAEIHASSKVERQSMESAAIKIQAAWRGCLTRSMHWPDFQIKVLAGMNRTRAQEIRELRSVVQELSQQDAERKREMDQLRSLVEQLMQRIPGSLPAPSSSADAGQPQS
ncbi:hypothetical protein HK105_206606 [Polyrhizophydium stewartii]|uniref:Uncharacterized protein n=1 Tax=Polyrhizophydium stewartii TaxID=2732419 RepID=A0ABR4N2U3_9FUNG